MPWVRGAPRELSVTSPQRACDARFRARRSLMSKPVCVVVGVGPGNGAALARCFHREGYAVAMLARSTELTAALARELDGARAYSCDVSDEADATRTFPAIAADMGPVEVLVYNAGAGVWGTIEDVSAKDFEHAW